MWRSPSSELSTIPEELGTWAKLSSLKAAGQHGVDADGPVDGEAVRGAVHGDGVEGPVASECRREQRDLKEKQKQSLWLGTEWMGSAQCDLSSAMRVITSEVALLSLAKFFCKFVMTKKAALIDYLPLVGSHSPFPTSTSSTSLQALST